MLQIQYSNNSLSEEFLELYDKNQISTENQYTLNLNLNNQKQEGIIFNPIQAIKTVLDKEHLIKMLRLNKIICPRVIVPGKKTTFPIIGRKFEHQYGTDIMLYDSLDECMGRESDYYQNLVHFKKEYIVHFCNLKYICIEEKYKDNEVAVDDLMIRTPYFGYQTKEVILSKNMKDKIYFYTSRAMAIIGLDVGYVQIGVTEDDKVYVIDIGFDIDRFNSEIIFKYLESIQDMIHYYDQYQLTKDEITIGCDPELLLKDIDDGTLYPASLFINNSQGDYGLDNRTIEFSRKQFPLLEIRPKYSIKPLNVYQNIVNILHDLGKTLHHKNIGIYGGSAPVLNYWLGGHIHFGIKPCTKFMSALDNYLALPIMMISKTTTLRQRNKHYGNLGTFRNKEHGGFEYCTLSSWLIDEHIIKAILCLSKLISAEFLNLQNNYLTSFIDHKAYNDVKKFYFNEKINKIIEDIKQTQTYSLYEKELDYLFDLIITKSEWNEDQNLKETFELYTSTEKYELKNVIYIPKQTRRLYHIEEGSTINVCIGRKSYKLMVLPLDDFSANKNGNVAFSENIYYDLKITSDYRLNLIRTEEGQFKCGPIIGIHCDENSSKLGPYGHQSLLFKRLIKIAKQKGMLVYVYSLRDINYEYEHVYASTYNLEAKHWYQSKFTLPDIIYDRGVNIVYSMYGKQATQFIDYFNKKGLKAVNDFNTINTISNKVKTIELLGSNPTTREYIPETVFASKENLYYMINKYDLLYIKLVDGSKGDLIYCIYKDEDNEHQYKIYHRDQDRQFISSTTTYDNLYDDLQKYMKEDQVDIRDYIIQQGLKFLKYRDYQYELRLLMVKNGAGRWTRVAMVARVRTGNTIFLGLVDHETKSSTVLRNLGEYEPIVRDRIYSLIQDVINTIEMNGFKAGEIAIDIGITKDLDAYIIELNSKPDTLLSYIGAYKLRHLYLSRILDYCKYLFKN